jgi:hypothetical protein
MAKRPAKPAVVPPARSSPPLGHLGLIFTETDVENVADKTGLKIKCDLPLEEIARRWSEAFYTAGSQGLSKGYPASPTTLREFYGNVESTTVALMKALGLSGDPAQVEVEVAAGAVGKRLPALALLQQFRFLFLSSADELRRRAAVLARLATSEEAPTEHGLDATVGLIGSQLDSIDTALQRTPFALATVITLASDAQKWLRHAEASAGRPPDHFRNILFELLAREFKSTFGYPVKLGREERRRPDCDSSIWIDQVLKIAAERIASSIHLQIAGSTERLRRAEAHPLTQAIKRVSELRFLTKADYLAAGGRKWAKAEANLATLNWADPG